MNEACHTYTAAPQTTIDEIAASDTNASHPHTSHPHTSQHSPSTSGDPPPPQAREAGGTEGVGMGSGRDGGVGVRARPGYRQSVRAATAAIAANSGGAVEEAGHNKINSIVRNAKESCVSAKEPSNSAKEPYIDDAAGGQGVGGEGEGVGVAGADESVASARIGGLAGSKSACVAVCLGVLQCVGSVASARIGGLAGSNGACVAVCCSVWQCVAMCGSVLQYVAVCCSVMQHVAAC